MSSIFRDPDAGWAAVLVVLLPLLIIGIGEFEERLRQRDSAFQRSVAILRVWVVPLFAIRTLAGVLSDAADDNPVIQLLGTGLVVSVTAAGLAALAVLVERIRDRPRVEGRRSVPRLLLALPRLLALLIAGWVLIAGVWNVDLSAALTALGVTSLVVSLALQDTLGGIASGFTLLADQPFQPGDWINTGELEGRVVDVNWRSSRIQTRDGDLVVVPNGQLAKATITNYDEPSRLHRVVVPVQVAYSNAPTAAKEMLLAAARSTEGVLAEPPPAAVVVQIDDPLMGYEVQMWVDDYSIVPRVKSDFGSLVWYHSHRFDVPLPSPAQDLYLWDGERNAFAGRPDHSDLVNGLRASPLIAEVGADEIDLLATGTVPARYAQGETILAEGSVSGPAVLRDGRARLVLRGDAGDEPVVDIEPGDLFGILDQSSVEGRQLVVVAVVDCDVLLLRPEVASGVISRSPGLTAAIDQLATSRRRRVARTVRRLEQAREMAELDAGLVADSEDHPSTDTHATADAEDES